MKHFSCGDVVPNCAAVFTAPTDDLLLPQIVRHAADDHGITELSDDLVSAVKANITTTAA